MGAGLMLLDGRTLLDAERLVRAGLSDRRAWQEAWFARLPQHTAFVVVAGIETLLQVLAGPLITSADADALRTVGGFSDALIDRLAGLSLSVDVDAVPEGTIAFPRAPIIAAEGRFLETLLLGGLV